LYLGDLPVIDRSVLKKLIEHAPLAVTVVGVVVFLAAAAGGLPVGEPPLAVASVAWRIALALLGTALVAAGVLLMLPRYQTRAADVVAEARRHGIRIDTPRPMSQIPTAHLTITGSYAVRPPASALRLFTMTTPDGRLVQPQAIVETFDEERRLWSADIHLPDPPRYSVFIVAALVGKTGEKLWDYYYKVVATGPPVLLDGPLPPDIAECQRIWVERI
jgi:hypothetical protein